MASNKTILALFVSIFLVSGCNTVDTQNIETSSNSKYENSDSKIYKHKDDDDDDHKYKDHDDDDDDDHKYKDHDDDDDDDHKYKDHDDDDDDDHKYKKPQITLPISYTPDAGRLLGSQCAQCHGTNGISVNKWDSIAGEDNLHEEMFEDDEPIMSAQARGYTNEEISLIENWLRTLKKYKD